MAVEEDVHRLAQRHVEWYVDLGLLVPSVGFGACQPRLAHGTELTAPRRRILYRWAHLLRA
jgi:hypothetical protein